MLSLRRLITISRPIFYLPALAVVGAGLTFAGFDVTYRSVVAVLFAVLPLSLIVYGVNDIVDRESDAKNSRKGGMEGAVLRQREVRTLWYVITATAFGGIVLFMSLRMYEVLLAVVGVYLFAWAYSVPPLRLKVRPLIDSLANGYWIACIFLVGYWAEADHLVWPSAALLVSIALCAAAYHAMGAALDYATDKSVGDTTIAVGLGKKGAMIFATLAFLAAYILLGRNSSPPIEIYLLGCTVMVALCAWRDSALLTRRTSWVIGLLLPPVMALRLLF